MKEFLKKKDIEISFKRYFVDAFGAMALGLFASLLIGSIFQTIADHTSLEFFKTMSDYAKAVQGPAMAIAIAYTLKAPILVLLALCTVGYAANALGGGPLGVFIVTVLTCEIGKLVSKQTKIDILVTPAVVIAAGCGLAMLIAPGIGYLMEAFGALIMKCTELEPFWMGMLISVIVGILLTLPVSSAAVCASLGLVGLAGGAAVAGCCAQMVGFAVMSFKENRWGGLVAQGIGTSMLQMGNIMKNPKIWIPPTLTSLITGPIATCIFHLENTVGLNAGMGTCGLVGPIDVISNPSFSGAFSWIGMILICFVLPAVLTYIFSVILRKIGWIRDGDLDLQL